MEQPGKNPSGVSAGSGGQKPPGPRSADYVPKHSEAQRAKWKEKYERKKNRRLAERVQTISPPGVPPPGAARPVVAPPVAPLGDASAGIQPGATPAAPPWTADQTRPLFEQLVPAFEKWDVESLKALAAKVDPELVQSVARDAAWNPASKTALCISLAQVSAKWLTKAGISPENAPEVALAISAVAIGAGRMLVLSGIKKAEAEKRSQRARSMLEKDRAAQPDPGSDASSKLTQ